MFLGYSPMGVGFCLVHSPQHILRTVFGHIHFSVVSPALLLRQVGHARSAQLLEEDLGVCYLEDSMRQKSEISETGYSRRHSWFQ